MAVITISRQFGAGGRTLGEMVAKKLNYRFLDDVIIQELSKRIKVSEMSVKDMEKTAGSFFNKIISGALSRNYMERLVGDKFGYIDEQIYLEKLTEIITELAEEDNVVLVGRGSQYILKDKENCFHFLLVAHMDERIRFIQKHYNLPDSKAEQMVQAAERRRKSLYMSFGKSDYNDPHLYHMVFNMHRVSLEHACNQIFTLVNG